MHGTGIQLFLGMGSWSEMLDVLRGIYCKGSLKSRTLDCTSEKVSYITQHNTVWLFSIWIVITHTTSKYAEYCRIEKRNSTNLLPVVKEGDSAFPALVVCFKDIPYWWYWWQSMSWRGFYYLLVYIVQTVDISKCGTISSHLRPIKTECYVANVVTVS